MASDRWLNWKALRDSRPWYRPLEYAKRRCSDKGHREYPGYGGRGITCSLTYHEAEILYKRDNGELLVEPSLDREEPDGHYTFENCRYIERVANVARKRPKGQGGKIIEPEQEEWDE